MKEQSKSNKKFLWGILLGIVTILLCYMFIVLYFFYISPYNISVKFALWPFLSDKNISDTYLDATVDIKFNSSELGNAQQNVIGVNVREDGFVLAPFHEFKDLGEGGIKIYANSGEVFDGKLLFAEENFDLAVLKCENAGGAKIKLPFVKIASLSSDPSDVEVFSISSPLSDANSVWKGKIGDNTSSAVLKKPVDGFYAADYVLENCDVMTLKFSADFEDGAVYDLFGNLLGFSFVDAKNEKGENVILPAKYANLFFGNVVSAYGKKTEFSNSLSDAFAGLDVVELDGHMKVSDGENGMQDHFLFRDKRLTYSSDLMKFYSASLKGYYLLEDFVYADNEIQAGNIITGLKIGGNKVYIETKMDLFKEIYNTKKGQNVQIEFMSLSDSQTSAMTIVV